MFEIQCELAKRFINCGCCASMVGLHYVVLLQMASVVSLQLDSLQYKVKMKKMEIFV